MSAEDPLIPLRRAKGGHFDNDSTGFAARKLVWIPDIQEAQDGTKSNAGFVRASLKSQDGDKVVVVQEGNNRTHNLTDVSPVAALFTAMGLCGGGRRQHQRVLVVPSADGVGRRLVIAVSLGY